MTYQAERASIEKRLLDNLSDVYVQFDNVLGLVDSAGNNVDNEQNLSEWVRLTILTNDSQQAELGTRFTRQNGLISIQVFVKTGTGTQRARSLAESIRTIFHIVQFDDITTRAGTMTVIGEQTGTADTDNFYQLNIDIPYHRHQS
tara:strand:+ start:1465 stop:1899 length:435 start_codon:yes stop_codon:yes gene_type:complete